MRTPEAVAALAIVAACASLTACGSSPEPRLYALSPTRTVALTSAGPPRIIKLRRPGIAPYLDRPEIVRRIVDSKIDIAADDLWGGPLDLMMGRVLAEDLGQRLPGAHVFTEDGAISAEPDAVVEVDVMRFDAGGDGTVDLVAEISVERGDGRAPIGQKSVRLMVKPRDGSTAALVHAMSDLTGQLADAAAGVVQSAR